MSSKKNYGIVLIFLFFVALFTLLQSGNNSPLPSQQKQNDTLYLDNNLPPAKIDEVERKNENRVGDTIPIPLVQVRSRNSCEKHEKLVAQLFSSSKNSNSNQIQRRWMPQICGTLWDLDSTESWGELDAVGWNITNGRRVQPDKKLSVTSKDRCASYDTGVFVPVSAKRDESMMTPSNKKSQPPSAAPWTGKLPPIYSVQKQNQESVTQLPLQIKSKNLLGTNFASFIAAGIHRIGKERNMLTAIPKEENAVIPPWIVFIGDSRSRHLLARLVTMIRSQFVISTPKAGNKVDEDFLANAEMRREGVIEHYYHLNATYTVFGYKRKKIMSTNNDEDFEYIPTSDRLYPIPEGYGCDSDSLIQNFETKSTTRREECQDGTEEKIQILFRICLWWHVRSEQMLLEGNDLFSRRLEGGVGAATWMWSLHECMGRNRRGKLRKKYTQCLFPAPILRNMIPPILEMIENITAPQSTSKSMNKKFDGKIKNFVLLSTPNSVNAPTSVVAERNSALKNGLRDWCEGRGSRKKIIINKNRDPDENDEGEKNVSDPPSSPTSVFKLLLPQNSAENDEPLVVKPLSTSTSTPLQVWFMDLAAWWDAEQPRLCDSTHTMCNLKPHRPLKAKLVEHFCDGCKDPVGFVTIRELMRLLLA